MKEELDGPSDYPLDGLPKSSIGSSDSAKVKRCSFGKSY